MSQSKQIIQETNKYSAPNYRPLPVVLERGAGPWVWDVEGNKYLDCLSAYSAVSQGHSHPRLIQAMLEQASKLALPSRAFYNAQMGGFLKRLVTLTGLEKALPMNSGAEAVETAIKAARKWGYEVKGVAPGKAEIIACKGNFHGRTTTLVSFSSEASYSQGFDPLTPGFVLVDFGNAHQLEAAINGHTVAFLVEPIQGEGGIILPPANYLKKAQDLCKKHNVLFILDEVQTGLGRTGKWFAFEHELTAAPDGVILGKALSGGMYPISAFVSRADVLDTLGPGTHGSTYGGNPLAAVIAMTALDIIEEESLVEKAQSNGTYLINGLKSLNLRRIKEIRGRGLLIGVELNNQENARPYVEALAKEGILSKETHDTVIRFAPPLAIKKAELDLIVAAVSKVLG